MHSRSPLSKWILMKNKTEIKLRMLLQNCSEVLSGFHYIFLSSFPSDEKQVHTYNRNNHRSNSRKVQSKIEYKWPKAPKHNNQIVPI